MIAVHQVAHKPKNDIHHGDDDSRYQHNLGPMARLSHTAFQLRENDIPTVRKTESTKGYGKLSRNCDIMMDWILLIDAKV